MTTEKRGVEETVTSGLATLEFCNVCGKSAQIITSEGARGIIFYTRRSGYNSARAALEAGLISQDRFGMLGREISSSGFKVYDEKLDFAFTWLSTNRLQEESLMFVFPFEDIDDQCSCRLRLVH